MLNKQFVTFELPGNNDVDKLCMINDYLKVGKSISKSSNNSEPMVWTKYT